MASVWEQRFASLVKRVLGLRESTTLEALPDLMPVLPVLDANDFAYATLRGDRWVSSRQTVVAVAAQGSRVQLFNNTTDRLVFVESVELSVLNVGDMVGWYLAGIHLAAGATGGYLDGRDQGSVPTGSLAFEAETSAASPATANWIGHTTLSAVPTAGSTVMIYPKVVLRPNQALRFECGTVNNGMRASIMYRERSCGPGELAQLGA